MVCGPGTRLRMFARPRRGSGIRRWCGSFIRSGGRRERWLSPTPRTLHWQIEQRLGERFFLCTQNVDDLHERAGSVRMVHMHGELAKARCGDECGTAAVMDRTVYKSLSEVGRCSCGARMRPHIVFFGEIPLEMGRIQAEIEKATLMVVVGTSGSVYPAASFVHWARQSGARTVYVGPERPLNAGAFTHVVEGKAGEVLPGLFV